jgi:outer membrane protein assembly complex protein YaeT
MTGTVGVCPDGGASVGTRAAGLLAVLAAFAAAAGALAQATGRQDMVTEVIVSGNHNINSNVILNKLKTREGRPYDPDVAKEDCRALTSMGSFRDVRPIVHSTADGKFIVEFHVEEHPNLIQDVVYKNARHLKAEDIDTLKLLRKGTPLNPDLCRKAVFDIKEFYQDKGYYFAEVQLEEGGRPTDTRIVFNVTEGPIVRVRSTSFTGNDTLATQARLRTQIDTSRRFLSLPLGGVFRPVLVNNDIQKLQDYYKSNGYLAATVSRQVYFSPDYKLVDVIFNINEGPRFKIKDVRVDGVKNLPPAQVEAILRLKPGDYYNETKITADCRNIQDLEGWRGYKVLAKKEPFIAEPGLVTVHYEVHEEGPPRPSRVGEIHIYGNEVTKERVIRRLLGLYPGQVLEYPQLRLAEQALARTQIFENSPEKNIRPIVELSPKTDFPDAEFKDIDVYVKEAPTGSLMVGVGVNSSDGLVGNIVLNERNFDILRPPTSLADLFSGRAWKGAGQEFRIEASPGTTVQRYTVSFREPYLFDTPYSLGVSGYYWDRIFNEYTESRLGMRVVLGHQLNRYWSISGSVRVEEVGVHNVSEFAPETFQEVVGENFLVGPRVTVTRDSRDSFLKPTEGSIVEASFEQVFGDFTFPIVAIDARKFFTVYQRPDGSGRHVVALRSSVSWEGSNAPVFERFYAGGFQTIRGFAFRGIGPYEIGTDGNLYRTGGDFMFLNSIEYQVPIQANDHLYAVGFLDSGTVNTAPSLAQYRLTAGVGLRIIVPMMGPVPIALDFAVPILRYANDENQLFSFYVGISR